MNITQVKQKTVTYQVMQQLKQQIADGVLKPNDKIPNEYELAEMFGVGRSTIREALKIFQYMGVVELRNPKGTFISESSNISAESLEWSMLLGSHDFTELIEMRIVMEQQGLWYLLEYHKNDNKLREETLKKLRTDIKLMNQAVTEKNIQMRLEADYNFHGHIIAVCKNKIFNNLYKTMRNFMVKEIAGSQQDIEQLIRVPQNHEKLVKAIEAGSYVKAAETFRHHIRNFDNMIEEKLKGNLPRGRN